MPEILIKGIPINFPFEPYQVQIAYMEKVISCLEKGGNGVLESPTGTGKTLSLLCASCAWLTNRKAQLQAQFNLKLSDVGLSDTLRELKATLGGNNNDNMAQSMELIQNQQSLLFRPPKIIYASRTHSQLTQAVQELKRTSYKYMKVSILGSRDQMCIHPEVSKEESNAMKTVLCRLKTKSKTCHFYNNVDKKKEQVITSDIMDIEDLVKLGRKLQCCPYYTSRELNVAADITFMPYNYLLDPKTRKNLGLMLNNSVIILDEAHNIEKICEESVSLSISNTDIAMCIAEVTQVMEDLVKRQESGFAFIDDESQPPDFNADDLCLLKVLFLELETAIDALQPGSTFPGDFMLELLRKGQLTPEKKTLVQDALNKIVTYLSTAGSSPFQRKGAALQKFSDLMTLVFRYEKDCPSYTQQLKISYKVHVSLDEGNKKKTNSWSASKAPQGKVINFWCFSPQFGLGELVAEGLLSLILTSGTLSPLDSFISELGIDVRETLENPHIVGDNQVCVGILKKGPDGFDLNSSFNTRNNPKYLSSLGRTLVNLSNIVPDGLLVFFPSYSFMKSCQETWQQSGIWSQVEKNKPIFVEPRTKNELGEIMSGYYSKIQDPATKGACFMAVTRGKVSEGLDFADFNGRAVVITGLPYPPFKDPRVELKKKYLTEIQQSGRKALTGMQWYMLEATKAVNQAVGRVIRHSNDYGLILLCDARFDSGVITGQLSSWLRPRITRFSEFGSLVRTVRDFFRSAEKLLPTPNGKPPASSSVSYVSYSGPSTFDIVTTGHKRAHSHTLDSAQNVSNDWLPNDYMKPDDETEASGSTAKSTEEKSLGILSALEKSSSCIDFNEVYVQEPSSSKDPPSSAGSISEQQLKKRKLKLVPLKFFNADSQAKIQSSSSEISEEPTESKKNMEDIIYFVKQVKRELGNAACEKLKATVKRYKESRDLKEMISALKEIFNSKSLHLWKGYERFVKREHREQYRELLAIEEIMRSM